MCDLWETCFFTGFRLQYYSPIRCWIKHDLRVAEIYETAKRVQKVTEKNEKV